MAYSIEEKQNIINRICEHISENKASLRDALLLDDMPNSESFYRWINEDEEKSKQYARACEERAEGIFEDILTIADESSSDRKTLGDKEVVDGEVVQRSRLRIDARKWMLSKMQPKKYGDKIDVTTNGKDISNQPLTPEQKAALNEELESDY